MHALTLRVILSSDLVHTSPMSLGTVDSLAGEQGRAVDPAVSLTSRLARGDEAAFREFHERYFDRLYRFLLSVARGDEQLAQEALQATLLRVARYVREFSSDDVFWSWLTRVARSAARDAWRSQQRYAALLERFAFWRRTVIDARTADPAPDRLHQALEAALESLAPQDRWLVEQKYYFGATVRELAGQTALTEKAVESRLLRLRRLLRAHLLNQLHDHAG